MGTKYSSNTASGYNSTPPPDDGTVSEANKGKWSTIKTKLSDPIKTLAESINTDLVTHFDNGPVAYTSNQTLGASNNGQVVQASGSGTTLTLSDAATLGSGWNCEISSTDSTNTVTVARATASDMINETTADVSLLPLQGIKLVVNAAANGFLSSVSPRQGKTLSLGAPLTVTTFSATSIDVTNGIGPSYTKNYSLAGTVGSNALTVTLSGYDGTALSATNKAQFTFGSATAGTGTVSTVDATANLTLVISSGSTLGATSAVPFRVWVGVANDAGTLRLVAINCSTSTNIFSISDDSLISSTAEGGAGAADSAGVWYSGAAVTTKAVRILGYMEFSLTTAGTWDEVPDKTRLWQPGMKLPGDVVQTASATYATYSSHTTTIPRDDTIPASTEGEEILSKAITATSTVNRVRVQYGVPNFTASAAQNVAVPLISSATSAAKQVLSSIVVAANDANCVHGEFTESAASVTWSVRIGPSSASTVYVNGSTTARLYGGAQAAYLYITEYMC